MVLIVIFLFEDIAHSLVDIFMIRSCKVVRAGLNVELAPDLVANQLNVRNGVLVLHVQFPLVPSLTTVIL